MTTYSFRCSRTGESFSVGLPDIDPAALVTEAPRYELPHGISLVHDGLPLLGQSRSEAEIVRLLGKVLSSLEGPRGTPRRRGSREEPEGSAVEVTEDDMKRADEVLKRLGLKTRSR